MVLSNRKKILAGGLLIVMGATTAIAQSSDDQAWDNDIPYIRETEDGGLLVGFEEFASWSDYYASDLFMQNQGRCSTPYDPDFVDLLDGGPADCSYNNTDPKAEYDPSVALYRIPVVFHILRASNGTTGHVPEHLVESQVEILNEDFLAMVGTNGEAGTDAQVEFYLATKDPDGNPTNGITYSDNTNWYNDNGGYYNTLAWDPHRYLNIYTNTASGALGYVPFLPQNGSPGSSSDRVVLLWSTVGRNAPYGHPYNLGRTATHEFGHYLGLFHTFNSGCGGGNCSTSGDRVCDTNPESNPHYGCGSRSTCSSTDPIENYMDYSDDRCMDNFTPDQSRRMRCTMEHYRPSIYETGTSYPMDIELMTFVAGESARFSVSGGDVGAKAAILWSAKEGNSSFQNVAGWCATFNLDIPNGQAKSRLVGQGTFNVAGFYTVFRDIPLNLKGQSFYFQAAQHGTCPDEKMSNLAFETVQ